jgi:large subunit ribosomal protein L4
MKIDVKNLKGENVGVMELPDDVFNVDINEVLLNQYMRYCLLYRRSRTANTKNRSDVAGSGKKRIRQKKSGRARQGEIAPHHRGGPIVKGPRVVNKEELEQQKATISKHINKKQKKAILAMILTSKLRNGALKIVDDLTMNEIKTRSFHLITDALGLQKRILFVDCFENFKKIYNIDMNDHFCRFYLSCRNCEKVKVASTFNMTVHGIIKNENLVMTKSSIEELMLRYGGANE